MERLNVYENLTDEGTIFVSFIQLASCQDIQTHQSEKAAAWTLLEKSTESGKYAHLAEMREAVAVLQRSKLCFAKHYCQH